MDALTDRSDARVPVTIADDADASLLRPIVTAELLAIGSELTTGDTRDTNAGDLARLLSELGVRVIRITELPDDRVAIADAFRDGLARSDVVVATGGLGPTPDDLTRESIGDAVGETPEVDAELERWVRGLWARRRIPFPEANLKQAWLVASATALPNDHGTAPGWWLDRPDGRIIVALPGPPREMRPMWQEQVVPRLRARRLGRPTEVRTIRLAGLGESAAADRIGHDLLEAPNPDVATFARADGVDVRVIAVADDAADAAAMADEAAARVREAVAGHIWAEGASTWVDVLDAELARTGLRLVTVERGTKGALAGLLGASRRLVEGRVVGPAAGADAFEPPGRGATRVVVVGLDAASMSTGDLEAAITIDGGGIRRDDRATALIGDDQGRIRAAVLAAWALLRALRELPDARA